MGFIAMLRKETHLYLDAHLYLEEMYSIDMRLKAMFVMKCVQAIQHTLLHYKNKSVDQPKKM